MKLLRLTTSVTLAITLKTPAGRYRARLRSATRSLGPRAQPRAWSDPTIPGPLSSGCGPRADPTRWLATGDRGAAGVGAAGFAFRASGRVETRDCRRG
jgi:hypothetical protein